jgi:hypothetical protein
MKVRIRVSHIAVLAVTLAIGLPVAFAQVQAAPTGQNAGVCGNQQFCYETNDFAAIVTDFRTSNAQNAYGTRLIDVMVHFQNKTNQSIAIGYVDGSGYALDERGNRYGLNSGGGGVRGMGVISGNNPNPQFTLAPGGGGDARFELSFNPGQAILGQTYELGLEFREINSVGQNQYQLGNDTLVHYTGLANGAVMASSGAGSATGAANGQNPTQTSQSQPCSTGATSTATTGSTANTVQQGTSTATNAISQVGSMLHGQSAGTTASSLATSVPCMPAGASGLMNSVGAVAPALGSMGATQSNGVYTAPGNYTNPGTYSAPANYTTNAPYGATTAAPVQPATAGTTAVQPIPTAKTATTAVPAAQTPKVAAPAVTAQPVPASKVTQITPAPPAHTTTPPAKTAAPAKSTKPAPKS